jgi:hypothetical protein
VLEYIGARFVKQPLHGALEETEGDQIPGRDPNRERDDPFFRGKIEQVAQKGIRWSGRFFTEEPVPGHRMRRVRNGRRVAGRQNDRSPADVSRGKPFVL